jgi:hypothetical protein
VRGPRPAGGAPGGLARELQGRRRLDGVPWTAGAPGARPRSWRILGIAQNAMRFGDRKDGISVPEVHWYQAPPRARSTQAAVSLGARGLALSPEVRAWCAGWAVSVGSDGISVGLQLLKVPADAPRESARGPVRYIGGPQLVAWLRVAVPGVGRWVRDGLPPAADGKVAWFHPELLSEASAPSGQERGAKRRTAP